MPTNALEHGGPGVTVTMDMTDVGFSIADDRPGISIDPPDRVFDAVVSSPAGNTGFGLDVAQRIANDHGWRLAVSERPAGGARFDVRTGDEP